MRKEIMPVSVKVYYGSPSSAVEIRRFIFRPEQHRTGTGIYSALLERIRALFNGLNLRDVHLCWKDEDGDYVVFSSDDELRVAISNTTDNTLRIFIRVASRKPPSTTNPEINSEPRAALSARDISVKTSVDTQNADEPVQRSVSNVEPTAKPPPPPSVGKPVYVQKRRAKVATNNPSAATGAIINGATATERKEKKELPAPPDIGRRRATRSKSIVNIMKVHTSTSSIPAAVDCESGVSPSDVQISAKFASHDQNGQVGVEAKPAHTNASPPILRKLTKAFSTDSIIFQETSAQQIDGLGGSDFLDADHPLMKRYQQAVKEHLLQQKEQQMSDLKQSEELFKRKQREYEKVGQDTFALRQELEKLRRAITQKDQDFVTVNKDRLSLEEQMAPLLDELSTVETRMDDLAKAGNIASNESRRLNTQIKEALGDVAITNHMTIAKNAVKKAQQDLTVVEQEKTKQENITLRLLDAADRKEVELKTIEAEIKSATAEIAEKRDRLSVLSAETKSISMEKRNLLQRWNATLKGMKRRDDEFAATQMALQIHQQNVSRVENELTGLAKAYANVRECNDRLIATLVRLQDDIEGCTTLISDTEKDRADVEGHIVVCQQTLDELAVQKNSMQKEKTTLANLLSSLMAKLRLDRSEIAKLEDSAAEFHSHIQTNDKSMDEAVKQLENLRIGNREMEKMCNDLETELEKETLIWLEVDWSMQALKKSYEEYKEMAERDRITYERTRQNFEKQGSLMNKKQQQIDALLKKLDIEKKSSNIHALLSDKSTSLRYELDMTQKDMNACDDRVAKLQQEWMKLQDQLIKASETFETENATINAILNAQTNLEQVKIQLSGEIAANEGEETQTKRKIDQLHLQIAKLNDQITKNRGTKSALESDHMAAYGHFSDMLKNAELECVQLEEKLTKKAKEKQDLENALQEAEHQLRIWELKTSEAKSVRDTIANGYDDEEFNRMLADVHRMQLRLGQLAKQQETTIKEMEKAVSKRNVLLQKGEAVTAAKTVQLTQAQLNRAVIDLRRKVKQFQRDLETAEREEEEYRSVFEASEAAVGSKASVESDAAQKRTQLMDEIGLLSAYHFKNSHLLAAEQMRHKRLEDARDGRYEPMCKDQETVETKRRTEMEKRELLLQLVSAISSTYPNLEERVKKIETLLNRMTHIRRLRGVLPLVKAVGETETALLTKVREKLLCASNVKFQFVEGFHLTAMGPPLDENAYGVVVALAGFDRPVLKERHEQLPTSYRAKISTSLCTESAKFIDFIHEFGSKFRGRDLVLNPDHVPASTKVPQSIVYENRFRKEAQSDPKMTKKTRLHSIDCRAEKDGRFMLQIDCWLNFAFPSIIKLMEEKLKQEVSILECRRTELGPWTLENCLAKDVVDSDLPSLDAFLDSFRQTRVLRRNLLESILTVDGWSELFDSRIVTR